MSASGIIFFRVPTVNLNAAIASISSAMMINRLIMLICCCFAERFLKLVMEFSGYETVSYSRKKHC